ncbi:MAG TPA: tripartite tricarboxylate transporter substrate binding protein [Burkholderiales bacterium]|nr:tripartite tricarboxylate transporter substrate binding protein [Burkholderiales bacterium]
MPFATGFRARLLIAVSLCMVAIAALAQPARTDEAFPNRPVRFLIPFAAAGSNDVVARILAHQLTDIWKQQVVADNRAGANGIIGIDMVAKAPADGYTLLIASTTFTMNPSLYKLPFDPVKDFAPVTLIAEGPLMLCSHLGFAARNVEQLIALAKAKPGQLQYASSGLGGIAHLAGVLLEKMAGISLLHVPYKGSGAGVIDDVSGQVPLIISSVSPVLPFVKNGRLRVLGIGGLKRSKFLPDVPTIAESGVPGYESNMWWGIMVPARTPKPVVQKLNRDIRQAVDAGDIPQRFADLGMEVRVSAPEELTKIVNADIRKWSGIIRDAKLDVDGAR